MKNAIDLLCKTLLRMTSPLILQTSRNDFGVDLGVGTVHADVVLGVGTVHVEVDLRDIYSVGMS